MAGTGTPVGPFPPGADPEEYDRRRRRVLWSLPSGLYVLGSSAGGRRNLMTTNWAMQVATEPKLVAVSVEVAAYTHELVTQGGVFALSVMAREDRTVIRRFVKPIRPEDDTEPDHLAGFAVQRAATGAPILVVAAAWLDCAVTTVVPCGSHTVFVGEVRDCGETADMPDVLRMEDTRMNYGG